MSAFVDIHIPFVLQLRLTVARVTVSGETIWQKQRTIQRNFMMRTTGYCIKTAEWTEVMALPQDDGVLE